MMTSPKKLAQIKVLKAWKERNRDKIREYNRRYGAKSKAKRSVWYKKWSLSEVGKKCIAARKEKNKANSALRYEVRMGRIIRKPCEVCKTTENIHGHHDDYSKPLEVRWLCPMHHSEAHQEH